MHTWLTATCNSSYKLQCLLLAQWVRASVPSLTTWVWSPQTTWQKQKTHSCSPPPHADTHIRENKWGQGRAAASLQHQERTDTSCGETLRKPVKCWWEESGSGSRAFCTYLDLPELFSRTVLPVVSMRWITRWSNTIFFLARSMISSSTVPFVTKR